MNIEGKNVFEQARWNKNQVLLCNPHNEESTNYPEIILVSPVSAETVPIHPHGINGTSFINLYGSTMENNGFYLLENST